MENVASAIPDKWRMIGIGLDLPPARLNAIDTHRRGNPHDCFVDVFDHWMNQPTSQRPFCWNTIITVLQSPLINEVILARKLRQKFACD